MIACAKSDLGDVPPDGTRPGQVGKLPLNMAGGRLVSWIVS